MNHALLRAKQRIGEDIPEELVADLQLALSDPDRFSAYIEHVFDLTEGAFYRFRVAHGIFYVLSRNNYPVTIFTQEQVNAKRRLLRASRKRPKWFNPRKARI
jgi:hypothetical protein